MDRDAKTGGNYGMFDSVPDLDKPEKERGEVREAEILEISPVELSPKEGRPPETPASEAAASEIVLGINFDEPEPEGETLELDHSVGLIIPSRHRDGSEIAPTLLKQFKSELGRYFEEEFSGHIWKPVRVSYVDDLGEVHREEGDMLTGYTTEEGFEEARNKIYRIAPKTRRALDLGSVLYTVDGDQAWLVT